MEKLAERMLATTLTYAAGLRCMILRLSGLKHCKHSNDLSTVYSASPHIKTQCKESLIGPHTYRTRDRSHRNIELVSLSQVTGNFATIAAVIS